MNAWVFPSILSVIMAGIYFVGGTYKATQPTTETTFYFMQLSISQAQFYLLLAILFALWGILMGKGSKG